jgi:hypothetical protein
VRKKKEYSKKVRNFVQMKEEKQQHNNTRAIKRENDTDCHSLNSNQYHYIQNPGLGKKTF